MSPNSSTSSSEARRFVHAFLLGATLLLVPGLLLSLYLEPLNGGLTRVGQLAERDFGQRQPQAALKTVSGPANQAEILVLGDSFSQDHAWQSELSRLTGLRTASYHLDVNCADDWLEAAINRHLSQNVRHIVLQSVERNVIKRFHEELQDCDTRAFRSHQPATAELTGERSLLKILPMNIGYLSQALRNHLRLDDRMPPDAFKRTRRAALTRDTLFSHRRAAELLYYADDENYKQRYWKADAVTHTLNFLSNWQQRAAARGIQLTVLVIPDKHSVYQPWIVGQSTVIPAGYDLYPRLTSTLGETADWLTPFKKAAGTITDFYWPNDTHLSLDGYRYLARELASRLSATRSASCKPLPAGSASPDCQFE